MGKKNQNQSIKFFFPLAHPTKTIKRKDYPYNLVKTIFIDIDHFYLL